MTKKLLSGLLLAGLLLTACSNQAKTSPSSTQSSQPQQSVVSSTSSSQQAQDDLTVFNSLIDQYASNGHYSHYAFYDINQDGVNELLLANQIDGQYYLGLFAYLINGQISILPEAYVASAGGHRSSLTLYQAGHIVYEQFSSYNGDGEAVLYQLSSEVDGLKEVQRVETQVGTTDTETLLGLTGQAKLDLTSLDWHTFDTQQSTSSHLDIDAISRGDYTSLVGTWTNEEGESLVFDQNGLVGDTYLLTEDLTIEDGVLTIPVRDKHDASSYILKFIPAGIVLPAVTSDGEAASDISDSQNSRIWTGEKLADIDHPNAFYYKVK